jgi:ZIP family zinc transporter
LSTGVAQRRHDQDKTGSYDAAAGRSGEPRWKWFSFSPRLAVMAIALALMTFVSTALGGAFALRHRDRLHLILGFTAGVILGVVAFDVLPEISHLATTTNTDFKVPMVALAAGFLFFHGVEKWLLVHFAHESEYAGHQHRHGPQESRSHDGKHHESIGLASALALAGHSLTDGVAIGLAFQVSHNVGFAVAIAVIGHDFADGLNTVALMLTHGNNRRRALGMLLLDALTPIAGAALTLLFTVPDRGLLIYLGAFAGFLLYIGASDILPEAHAEHPSLATLALTVGGAGLIYGIVGALP